MKWNGMTQMSFWTGKNKINSKITYSAVCYFPAASVADQNSNIQFQSIHLYANVPRAKSEMSHSISSPNVHLRDRSFIQLRRISSEGQNVNIIPYDWSNIQAYEHGQSKLSD